MATKRQGSVLEKADQQCQATCAGIHHLVLGARAEYVAGAAVGGVVGAGDDWLSNNTEVNTMTTAKDDLLGMLRGGDTAKSLATQMLETFPSMIDLLSESEQAEARQVLKEFGGVNAFNTLMAKKAEKRQREAQS
jgi:hypothetical protein